MFSEDLQFKLSEISPDLSKHRQVLALCVLRGGVFFYTDLVKQLDFSVELAFVKASSYDSNLNKQKEDSKVAFNIDPKFLKNRNILIIDDICDSGNTLSALRSFCLDSGANVVKSVVFLQRVFNPNNEKKFQPDWCVFKHYGPEWLVGYGMDDKDFNSNSPNLYIL